MLAQLIQQFTSEWVEYNRKTLINKIFRNDPQILGVVDVGCGGYQTYLPFLSKKFPNSIFLLGVDISKEKTVQVTDGAVNTKVDYILADADALPFKNLAFSLAFAKDLLHHVSEPIKVLKEIKRTSQKIVIVEGNRANALGLLWVKYGNHKHFTLNQLEAIVKQADLEVICLKQLHAYPFDLLLSRIRNPIVFLWDALIFTFLFACYLKPILSKFFLHILTFFLKPSCNIVYASGREALLSCNDVDLFEPRKSSRKYAEELTK